MIFKEPENIQVGRDDLYSTTVRLDFAKRQDMRTSGLPDETGVFADELTLEELTPEQELEVFFTVLGDEIDLAEKMHYLQRDNMAG